MTALLLALALANVGHVLISPPLPVGVRAPDILGDFGGAIGDVGTNDRPDPGTYEWNGVVYTAAAGRSRNIPSDGTLIEGQGTNKIQYSENAGTSPWGESLIVTQDSPACPSAPAGGSTADLLSFTLSNQTRRQNGPTPLAYTTTASAYFAARTGDGAATVKIATGCIDQSVAASCSCGRSDNGSCSTENASYNCFAVATVSEAWTRVWATATCATTAVGKVTYATGSAPNYYCAWGAQLENGPISSYIPTTSAPVTRRAERPYYTSEGCPGHAMGKWSVSATVKPYGGAAWNLYNRTIWSAGTKDAANTVRQVATTAGTLVTTYVNGSTQTSTETVAHGMAPIPILPVGNGKQIAAQNIVQDLEQLIDGVKLAETQVDGGARTWSATPTTIYFGSNSTTNDEVLNGYIRDWYCQPTEMP